MLGCMSNCSSQDRRLWFFVSDLHGDAARYSKLFATIRSERPRAVLLGGDLLPNGWIQSSALQSTPSDFIRGFLAPGFESLREELGHHYPRVLLIFGNDDARAEEDAVMQIAQGGTWDYIHGRQVLVDEIPVFGYSFVPPTPFQLKDWERYDVSRFVDPGCVPPDGGYRTVPISDRDVLQRTIQKDLQGLVGESDLGSAVFLFHSPPYQSNLDRAALDGKMVDYAPLDVHVGSIAIQRFIEKRQPAVTLHGHVHESARLTGSWSDHIGATVCLSAAHDGPELALVHFDPKHPGRAARRLL